MSVKLKDIAEQTGFSINTVSRALRDDRRLSDATRNKIKVAAEEMGYIRNILAESMRSNKSRTIGVIFADSANPFYAEVIQGIEERARRLKYSILLINTGEQAENERKAVRLLLGRQVDGLVIAPVYKDRENLALYQSLSVPFIMVGRYIEGLKSHSILHGDAEGQAMAFEHLLRRGHKKILYIAGPKNISNTIDRMEGMKLAYEKYALQIDESYIFESSGHMDDGYRLASQALERGLFFTAVVCFNDLLAFGVLKALHEKSISVPDDMEIIGFDNLAMSQFMQPGLTTVDVPKNHLGQKAVEELVYHIEDVTYPYNTIHMKPRLIHRETTLDSHIQSLKTLE